MLENNIISQIELIKSNDANLKEVMKNICNIIDKNDTKKEYNYLFLKNEIKNNSLDYALKRAIKGSTITNFENQNKFILLFKLLIKLFYEQIEWKNVINYLKENSSKKLSINKTELKHFFYFQFNALNFFLIEFKNESVKSYFIDLVVNNEYITYLLSGFIYNNHKEIMENDFIKKLYFKIFQKINYKEQINYNKNLLPIALIYLLPDNLDVKKQFEISISPKTLNKSINILLKQDWSNFLEFNYLDIVFKIFWSKFFNYGEKIFNFIDLQLSELENDKLHRKNRSIILLLILKNYLGKNINFGFLTQILNESKYFKITQNLIKFYLIKKKNKHECKQLIKNLEATILENIKNDKNICFQIYQIFMDISMKDDIMLEKDNFLKKLLLIIVNEDKFLETLIKNLMEKLNNVGDYKSLKKVFSDIELIFSIINENSLNINNIDMVKNLMNELFQIKNKILEKLENNEFEIIENLETQPEQHIEEYFYSLNFSIINKSNNCDLLDYGISLIDKKYITNSENVELKEFFKQTKKSLLGLSVDFKDIIKLVKIFLLEKSVILDYENSQIHTSLNDILTFISKYQEKNYTGDDKEIFFDAMIFLLSICDKSQRELINRIIQNYIEIFDENCFEILFDELLKDKKDEEVSYD